MPVRNTPPTIAAREATSKIVAKRQEQETINLFLKVVVSLAVLHLILSLVMGGIQGYLYSWKAGIQLMKDFPILMFVLPIGFGGIFFGINMWRNPEIGEIRLPPYPAIDDLRFNNDIYVGSGWTRSGKQPGDEFEPKHDEILGEFPHVILKEKGLFGNLHVKGGVGGGKTATLIMPFLHQAINKYPKPPKPEEFKIGPKGVYEAIGEKGTKRKLGIPKQKASPTSLDPESGPIPEERWQPYIGLTKQEAEKQYEELSKEHTNKKWGVFVIDPKGDMTEKIQRMAILAGREQDVFVLRPHGEYTYNALDISDNALVQSEMVMDGIEAVAGQAIQQYWRQTQSEWLSNALTILSVVDPRSKNFKGILKFARNEGLREAMILEAEGIMKKAQAEEEYCRQLGQPYHGKRVNPAAIDFFKQWDDADTDVKQKQAVVSGIQAQAKFFVEEELADFLCPEMPPTFPGFDAMIDQGHIVVLQMPIGKWSAVAKVLGILVLADAQQAARDRINKTHINQERVVAFVVDEIASYLNKLTKEFISINRQSRVCFLASHQSQGQLLQSDRGFETSFNDNLRTKLSYSAPNADSARKESALFGAREVFKESWSQSESFANVKTKDETSFTPAGPQSKGASMSIQEVERPWFAQEEFMTLKMGELIISEFDGVTTLSPRRIMAPPYFAMPSYARAEEVTLEVNPMPPHPVIVVPDPEEYPESRDYELLIKALDMTGFVVLEPLLSALGVLSGIRFVTDVGTIIVPISVVERLSDDIKTRLSDSQTLVVLGDLAKCAEYLGGYLGVEFNRVLGLVDIYERVFPEKKEQIRAQNNVAGVIEAWNNLPRLCPSEGTGAWEEHQNPKSLRKIREDSRQILNLFMAIGEKLDRLGNEVLEDWHLETQNIIQDIIVKAQESPEEILAEHAEPGAVPLEPTPEDFAEEVIESFGDPSLVAQHEAAEEAARMEEESGESWAPGIVNITDNPYSQLTPEALALKGEWVEEHSTEEEVDLSQSMEHKPKVLQRRKKKNEESLEQLTQEVDANSKESNDENSTGRTRKGSKTAKSKGSSKSNSQTRSGSTSATGRGERRKKDRGHLDLGLDADGPAVPATEPPGPDKTHGGSDILSGAPIH